MWGSIRDGIKHLFPGYFALVMATGIVSIAAYLMGMRAIAWWMFRFNVLAYAGLWLLTLARGAWFGSLLLADLTNHVRGRASLPSWPRPACSAASS